MPEEAIARTLNLATKTIRESRTKLTNIAPEALSDSKTNRSRTKPSVC